MGDPGVLSANKCMKPIDYIKSDVNILLLGESGVGKSTFINSFANYLQYETLKEALGSELYCLIPTVFTITDENFQDRIIHFGYDDNEDRNIGNSSTQYPRAYVFPIKGQEGKIRLIDTPGIGDSRGVEQDEKNFENTLTYLSQFTEIHAICFLLKPNVSVINAYFKFCINHLVSRLEVSAGRNIVFVFTNSRGSFYRPGSTSGLLEIILREIKSTPPHVEIPFCKENKFCVDNEVFNYLVAVRKGVQFGDAEKEAYATSWKKSVEAARSFLNYIAGGEDAVGLTPHRMQDTLSVNDARRLVLDLTKPLTDISDLIQDNLCTLNAHKKHVLGEDLSMGELEKSLYIPVINLKQISLPDPVVVCTSNTCAKICIVSGLKKHHYTQKCCKPCTSANIMRNLIGSPSLLNCRVFDSNNQCTKCKCDFSSHMQIFYETELHEDTIVDESIKKEIKSKEDMIEARYKVIVALKGRISEYEEERDKIMRAIAKFAHFLKKNSISSYNDAFQDYIDYLIDRENSLGTKRNQGVVARYKYLKKQHEEEKKLLDSVTDDTESPVSITPKEIQDFIESLYNLKHTGKKIRELHTKQQKVRLNLHVKTMEYCHPKQIERAGEKEKAKKAAAQKVKKVESELGKMSLEELQKNTEMEDMLKEYLKRNLAEAKQVKKGSGGGSKDSNAGSAGAKNEKKDNNAESGGSKNEKKGNNTESGEGKNNSESVGTKKKNNVESAVKNNEEKKKKDVVHIKNNLEKAKAEDGENKNQPNNPRKKKGPQQQNVPYNQNQHPYGQPPTVIPMQVYAIPAQGNHMQMHPNQFPNQHQMQQNQFPMQQNQYQMQQNQFPMQPNQFQMQQNQYMPQSNTSSGFHHQQQNLQYPPRRGNLSNASSLSNLSEASGSDAGKPRRGGMANQRGGMANQRGKSRGAYKNTSQSRDNSQARDSTPHYKKNVNQFKKPPARKSRGADDGSDSDRSRASSRNRRDKKSDEAVGEKLDYQKMMRFLEEQKKIIGDVNKKSGGDKKRKSETIIMMIRKDE